MHPVPDSSPNKYAGYPRPNSDADSPERLRSVSDAFFGLSDMSTITVVATLLVYVGIMDMGWPADGFRESGRDIGAAAAARLSSPRRRRRP